MRATRIPALLLLAAACGGGGQAEGAMAPRPDALAPTLEMVARQRTTARTYEALGLEGGNKPNGMAERLRRHVPPRTPVYVPRRLDGLDLSIADETAEGWLAFYRGPMELRPGARNADFRAVMFGPGGERRWDLPLNPLLSRPDRLEIQDVRWGDGHLYLNEACQSYSREAGGQCSALLRVDPRTARVVWRTAPLVSNGILILHGPYVVAGYGFTAETDHLHLVDRQSGAVVARAPLDSAPSYLEVKDGRLVVVTHQSVYTFSPRVPGT